MPCFAIFSLLISSPPYVGLLYCCLLELARKHRICKILTCSDRSLYPADIKQWSIPNYRTFHICAVFGWSLNKLKYKGNCPLLLATQDGKSSLHSKNIFVWGLHSQKENMPAMLPCATVDSSRGKPTRMNVCSWQVVQPAPELSRLLRAGCLATTS